MFMPPWEFYFCTPNSLSMRWKSYAAMIVLLAFTACTKAPTAQAPSWSADHKVLSLNNAGAEVDIAHQLVRDKVNVIEFYADW